MKRIPIYNRIVLLTIIFLMASCGGKEPQGEVVMETGELIFVSDTTGMGSAIEESTGTYTHTAIIEQTDSGVYVWEALPRKGVIRSDFESWKSEIESTKGCHYEIRKISQEFDTARLVILLNERLGQPYDDYFAPDNGRCYCSELAEECFYNKKGEKIFHTKAMNFRDKEGRMPEYWTRWFDSLGVAVPEGEPGTNPTDLHKEVCGSR